MDFSFQLYSARNYPPLDNVLRRLAELGYAQVEGYGGLYAEVDSLAESLRRFGLSMPTGHFGLDLLKDTSKAMKIAETLGIRTLFCPAIPQDQRRQPAAGWVQLGETLASLHETYRQAGFGFGWHNHHFEFWPTETGRLPIEIILGSGPLEWQMDVAWVVRGDNDPLEWMERFGDRITAVHVKDIDPAGESNGEDGWADVGHGTMGWDSLIDTIRSRTAAKVFVMEHDNPADVDRFARRSLEIAKRW